ncbi:phthiocerol/phenolphthiocerol synthesis type-I polyketide synthase E [Thermoflexales bacterium]|nr:phthiocerol/phenolphthiocerol synthesis type-I polyketide synthase E [Thermoflexales bacterium]
MKGAPSESWTGSEIAIIGMAGRFPGARNIDKFWQNLRQGVESIHLLDDQELAVLGVEEAVRRDPNYVKAAAVMEGIDLFDAAFFGYTPREAELMDPQHRVLLECAWETLEHAGYDPARFPGAIGMFAGGTTNTYLLFNLMSNRDTLGVFDPMQIDIGNGADFYATRVSYKLNLTGPSFTLQTACSTALVALHTACQSLLNEECDLALAGGVSIHVKHPEGYWYVEGGNVSPDGHCRAFDAQGRGTIFGSGVGLVLLKRLENALADRDHIHAIVRGSAINNDGAGKVGFTAPSITGQAGVITEALAFAGIKADTIRYVETHGTATKLGDPVEIRALTRAFQTQTTAKHFCAIGSVKSNVGHLASAAGAASIIKTAMMLQHQQIPPSLHFEKPNPEIDFENSPFYISTSLTEWASNGAPRRAGVSSFGVGGTNAHAILEEAPAPEPVGPSRPVQLLLLSTKTVTALEAAQANLAQHLNDHSDLNLADVAYTLHVGRQTFAQRHMLICRTTQEAATLLAAHDTQRSFSSAATSQERPVVFMFPGMGDQYPEMALELYQTEPTFRQYLDRAAEFLKPELGLDLRTVLYPNGTAARPGTNEPAAALAPQIDLRKMLRRGNEKPDSTTQQLNETWLAHPILFALEYALAQVWLEWGVQPRAMIGYSIGEYVAACLAGVYSFEEGLSLVAKRAQMIQKLPGGAMLAVLLPEEAVLPWLNEQLSLAAVNTAQACVVSGAIEAITQLERQLIEKSVACQRIHSQHAFHSTWMTPIVEPFRELLHQVTLRPPTIPFFSNVTGDWITANEATSPDYWARHMSQTVRFASGLQALLQQPQQVLLEMGPGQTLTALAKQHPAHTGQHVVMASLRQPHQQQSDVAFLLNTLGRLWVTGVKIDWPGFYIHERRARLPLPTYPFDHQRYWIEPKAMSGNLPAQPKAIRRAEMADWFYTPTWKQSPQPPQLAPNPETKTWLIFEDKHGLAMQLAQQLVQAGYTVSRARFAEQFARLSAHEYTLNSQRREDYAALLQALSAQGHRPNQIIHCASLTSDRLQVTRESFQSSGFNSLIYLAQALEEQNLSGPIDLSVISNQVCQIESADEVDPTKALLLSPCRVIPQEYPTITCRYLDIPAGKPSAPLVRQLLRELQSAATESIVAYRGPRRWIQSFEAIRLTEDSQPSCPLREAGVYVIVNGLTGVGWALAQYLTQTVNARLVLLEDAGFPESTQWAQLLDQLDTPVAIRQKIQRAQQLEQNGAQVLILKVNGADPEQMRSTLARAADRFGTLHGVIHTLGSVGAEVFSPIQDLDNHQHEQTLIPTMQNLAALAETLTERELDFCMLTSSLSSVLGGLGQATHAAISLMMDALAEQQNQATATPWISVDWDVWQPEEEATATMNASLAQYAIAPLDGVEAARRILINLPGSRIVVSTGDLAGRLMQRLPALVELDGQTEEGALRAQHPRPQLSNPYVAPRTELERTIVKAWQEVFGLEQIGIDDNFFELGGNSLIAIHTMGRLKKQLHADVPTAALYQRPTARFLAELLAQDEDQAAQQMAERLAKRKADLSRRTLLARRR